MRVRMPGAYNGTVNNRPGHVVRRKDGDVIADLTEHRIVHRGIEVDLSRLSAVAAEFSATPMALVDVRWDALRTYLAALSQTITSHRRVDTGCLAELLTALTGAPANSQSDQTPQLIRLLDDAQDIVVASGGPPGDQVGARLATVLAEAAHVAGALFARQEQVVFPLILEYMNGVDYRWVQGQFRAELPGGLLAFVAAWTVRHATGEEVLVLTDPSLCVTQRIFAQRFAITEGLLFG